MTFVDEIHKARALLQKMDLAPDGKEHDKKCWFCSQCGDDLQSAIKALDRAIELI